jgi:hypothetical protein
VTILHHFPIRQAGSLSHDQINSPQAEGIHEWKLVCSDEFNGQKLDESNRICLAPQNPALRDIGCSPPPVTLQRKYEELVARHERMRSRQLELISESDVLFHSLVQRAFRGQL